MIYLIIIALLVILNIYIGNMRNVNQVLVIVATVVFGIFATIGLGLYVLMSEEKI